MTVFQVIDFDPMASSWGEDYVEGTYSTREKAQARADALNAAARAHWMRTATSPENYRDMARVVETTVK